MNSIRRIVAAAALTLCATMPIRTAHALEFQCVEASRYRPMMRIFGEDPEALITYFRLTRTQLPPMDACRAMIVSGTLEAGDARKLEQEIVRNRGWLAALYLASSGSNRDEEVKIGVLIRTFWLKTFHFGRGPQSYEPDFVTRSAIFGPSVTTAWPPVPTTRQPLQAGRDDYLRTVDRKLPETVIGAQPCLESCISFFLAGMDRFASNPNGESVKPLNGTPADLNARIRTALHLWLDNTLFDETARELPVPVTMATAKRNPPAAAHILFDECSIEIDANTGAQEQVLSSINGLAKNSFDRFVRVENVMPRFDAVHTTVARLQTCIAGTFDRRRLEVYRQQCGGGTTCTAEAIDAAIAKRSDNLIKSWTPPSP